MHCPNCGTKASAGQKFCRACGLSLERFAQVLAETLPDVEDENLAKSRLRLRQLEITGKITRLTIGIAIALLIGSMGISQVTENGANGGGIAILVFLAILLVGVGLLTYYTSLLNKVSDQKPAHSAAPSAETTNKLLPEDQSRIATSVTEQTTARLGEKIETSREDE